MFNYEYSPLCHHDEQLRNQHVKTIIQYVILPYSHIRRDRFHERSIDCALRVALMRFDVDRKRLSKHYTAFKHLQMLMIKS